MIFQEISKSTQRLLTTVFSIILVLIAVAFAARREYAFAFETVMGLAVYLIFTYYEKRSGVRLENHIRLFVMITVVFNAYFGEYLKLYYTNQFFDKILHMFGTFSFSLAAYSIVNKKIQFNTNSRLFIFIIVLSLGTFLGTLFEIAEFTMDSFLGTYNQHGLTDTNLDVIFNMLGAAFSGVYCTRLKHPKFI